MDDAASLTSPLVELTSDIVGAYVSNNNVRATDLPGLIAAVHASLSGLGQPVAPPEEDHKVTAAQIRKSVTPDHITSFLDGKPYKSLKRHLTTRGFTPDEYRQKFGLPFDYPMVAANYAAQRSELAKSLGLGQIRRERSAAQKTQAQAQVQAHAEAEPKPEAKAEPAPAPARRGRPRKAEAASEG